MYKVIDLGSSFEATGEPRVRLVSNSLVKTASTEIQDFWDKIEPSDDSSYLWVIGVSSAEYYGCNNNGDAFHEADLKNCHHHFVDKANVFLHHVNRDPAKGIGKPVFSWFNDEMHRVELILRINKNAEGARDVVAKIANNEQLFVSMGCSVKFDVCSICGNQSPTRAQYCDHLRYNMKKILPDGKQVFAWNPDPQFFDISIVRKPADPTAYALDKIASEGGVSYFDMATPVVSSAELGERIENTMAKTAAFEKLSEIYKTIDAIVADTKNKESKVDDEELDNSLYYKGFTDAVRMLTRNGVENLGNMSLDHHAIDEDDVTPGGIIRIVRASHAPFSLGDGALMIAKHFFNPHPSEDLVHMLSRAVPVALDICRQLPEMVDPAVNEIMDDYHGECDSPEDMDRLSMPHREPLKLRIMIVRKIMPLQKIAYDNEYSPKYQYGNLSFKNNKQLFTPNSGYAKLHFKLPNGQVFAVSRNEIMSVPGLMHALTSSKGIGAMLGLGGLALIGAGSPESIFAGTLVGGTGLRIMTKKQKDYIRSEEGVEVPVEAFTEAYKKRLDKTAGSKLPTRLAYVGGIIPALAGLDYLASSKFGIGKQSDGIVGSVGEHWADSPMLTSGLGMLGGGMLGHAIKNLSKAKKIGLGVAGGAAGLGAYLLSRKKNEAPVNNPSDIAPDGGDGGVVDPSVYR